MCYVLYTGCGDCFGKKKDLLSFSSFCKNFKSTNGLLSCKWQENYRHKNIRRGQMKAFVFAECAKVTLKKCKNAKIVNYKSHGTQNGTDQCL